MKQFFFQTLCLIISINSVAQQPVIQWQDVSGGTEHDDLRSVIVTSDGNYVTVGSTQSNNGDVSNNHGGIDVFLMKYNQNGSLLWTKTYGGSSYEFGIAVRETSDGGFIIFGTSYSTDGDANVTYGSGDFWIVKTDAVGNLQWQKSYGTNGYDRAKDIRQTSDGGYIIIGAAHGSGGNSTNHYGNSDIWILKLNSAGDLTWQRIYGGASDEKPGNILQTPDGGYIFLGDTSSCGGDVIGIHDPDGCTDGYINRDLWLVKLTASGDIVWQSALGTNGNDELKYYGDSLQATSDGGYVVCGSSNPSYTGSGGSRNFIIYKLSAIGATQWSHNYGGLDDDYAYSIVQTSDGGYVVSGDTESNFSGVDGNHSQSYGSYWGKDIWTIKLDALGILQWQKCYGGFHAEYASSMQLTVDGGLIIAGSTSSTNTGDVVGGSGPEH
ncbi:MAG TPA: hypothetical protein VF581_01145, partial [Flavobacterium sp.]